LKGSKKKSHKLQAASHKRKAKSKYSYSHKLQATSQKANGKNNTAKPQDDSPLINRLVYTSPQYNK
jgi:hypothetical protein